MNPVLNQQHMVFTACKACTPTFVLESNGNCILTGFKDTLGNSIKLGRSGSWYCVRYFTSVNINFHDIVGQTKYYKTGFSVFQGGIIDRFTEPNRTVEIH